jgi:hypothetical protein
MRSRQLAITLGTVVAIASALPAPVLATTYEFPPGETGYHTYEEMAAELAAAAAAHPAIVARFSIGTSYKGRDIWAAKVSDNVGIDEDEPEVLLEALHHGDEHMATEMALAVLRWLTTGYASDPAITSLVERREIFIVFMVNPDGATYNIKDRVYQDWRKNRQPNAGSSSVGTDLNRNYDYRWGCCGGASSSPASSRYRGAAPFSAPETRAVRDFVNSRVVNGRQQIRASASFHTTGRIVAWPYSYTSTNVPSDMTALDQAAFVAMGTTMAERSRYTPRQAGDWYVHSGTALDWLYGRHRIMAFLFELEPDTSLYLPDEKIAAETARNKSAVLYLIEQAGCPHKASGRADMNCGPLYDDLEGDQGWTLETSATRQGRWQRGDPAGVSWNGPKQLSGTVSGRYALVTGLSAGSSARANDLDGPSRIVSREIFLPAGVGNLSFHYAFAHERDTRSSDYLRVAVRDVATDLETTLFEERGDAADQDAAWAKVSRSLAAFEGRTVRIVIEARDGGLDTIVEAAIDDIRIERGSVPLP